jgi:predicted 3-demethylubiquinone-9 3-methyltransferase (glyoxalase superfamily)
MTSKIHPFLWFDTQAEEAAKLYTSIFPNSKLKNTARYPDSVPGMGGKVMTVDFEIDGLPVTALNAGPHFKFNEAISLYVETKDQAETDKYWNAIVGNGGQESQCGWCKDKWGVSWQITPRTLIEAMVAGGAEAKRAFDAMMKMQKIDVAKIDAARRG